MDNIAVIKRCQDSRNKPEKMKKFILIVLLSNFYTLFAQPNTDVYLFDIVEKNGIISFENMQVIANQSDYENQPSFYDNNTLLFVATRNGQTDIVKYQIDERIYAWYTDTPGGSEYSPRRIPDSDDISAVRLDTTGLQRLYRYKTSGKDTLLIDQLKVGYYVWDTKDQLISSVLVKNGMNLMLNYLPENKNNTIDMNVGRSLHRIPKTKLLSFISNKGGAEKVSSFEPVTGEIKDLINLPASAQDMCWYDDKIAFVPIKNTIAKASSKKIGLKAVHTFGQKEIYNITRMAISPDKKHLALVTDQNPELLLNNSVSAFNRADLNGFVSCFSDSVMVSNFPEQLMYSGIDELKKNYADYFSSQLVPTQVKVVNRIQLPNWIIDEEEVTKDSGSNYQAVLYKIQRGQIEKMSFIHDENASDPRNLVALEEQLEVYNYRNLDAFCDYFIDNIEMIDDGNDLVLSGKEAVKQHYADFFEKAKDLTREVLNRIVIGNTIVDEEIVKIGTGTFRNVVVYEMSNGLIKRITFIR
jgi:hypothetical protein